MGNERFLLVMKLAVLTFGALILCLVIFMVGWTMVNGMTTEYKYTKDVSCYDERNSKINELTCEHKVYCGAFQKNELLTGYSCTQSSGGAKNG